MLSCPDSAQASLKLLGKLLFKVAGTTGNIVLDGGSDDEVGHILCPAHDIVDRHSPGKVAMFAIPYRTHHGPGGVRCESLGLRHRLFTATMV